ncbi:MAG: TonB-dependent receptor [Puia sp.]|nr:TonB-dependent receptor [Puia sp.]
MKNAILSLILAIPFTERLIAQIPSFPGGIPKGGPPAIHAHLFGKITDSAGKPVSGASVVLLQMQMDSGMIKPKQTLLQGRVTKANGEFNFEDLAVKGPLSLKVSATGYRAITRQVALMGEGAPPDGMQPPPGGGMPPGGMPPGMPAGGMQAEKDLGNIHLSRDFTQLAEVSVTATKPTVKMDIDKKVYNVEKDIVSLGGTALDVMRNVPSVQVDIDGNVTMRNSTPTLYIDGRPTTLTLDQIPASSIESVEVITNPSAKYDASGGTAGILNIILKKNRKTGYNGNLRAGVDKYGGIDGGGDFNLRQGKINLSANVMIHQMKGVTRGNTDRLNLTDDPETRVEQSNYQKDHGGFAFGRLGLDYFIDNRNTLSISGVRAHGSLSPFQDMGVTTDSLYPGGTVSAYNRRTATTDRVFNGTGVQTGFRHQFPHQGEEWTVDANYFSGKNTNNTDYTTDYYQNGPGSAVTGNLLQNTYGYGNVRFLTVQTDYVKPFSPATRLEAGLRASLQHTVNVTDNYTYSDSAQQYLLIPAASTNYRNDNNVYAAYVSFTSRIGDFGYQLGLRAESSDYSGDLITTSTHFGNHYPISLFPSVFLSQKLKNRQEVQFSFTRRVNRPNFFQLIPYTDYSDSLNITRGNPALVPEFTYSFELSYTKQFLGSNTVMASVYYKRTIDLITRYLDTAVNGLTGKEDVINTYINANSSYTAGLELTGQNTITRWWDVMTNVNAYRSSINTGLVNAGAQNALWSWFGKLNSNFKLPAKLKFQLTATYQSKTNLPVNQNTGLGGPPNMQSQSSSQGYIRPSWGIDLALSRSFLKNDAMTASVSVSDIFRTRVSDQHSESIYFIQDYNRLRDPQMVRVNLSYRFGKMDFSLFKRKVGDENMQNATQF